MIKVVSRLLVLALFVAVPVKFLYSQQANPAKDKPAEKKQAADDKAKPTEESGEKETTKKTEGKDITLKEIVVKGQQFIKKSPYTINVIDSSDIEKKGIDKSADIIKAVPGVKVHDYYQGGISNAVAIRGFQSGIHGGDMGVYLDGIPLNEYYGHGGGYADPNVLIPIELDRVLVYKGPSSALFGNFSRGGTIEYFTKKTGDYIDLYSKYGSWNTVDAQGALGKSIISDTLWNNSAVQIYRTDGFTSNSRQLYGTGSTRFTYKPIDKLEISISLRAHSDIWDAPGYISRMQWGNKKTEFKQQMYFPTDLPTIGPKDIGDKDGGERKEFIQRVDASYLVNDYVKILAWGFGLQTNWVRFSKFGNGTQSEQDYGIGKYGAGCNMNYDIPLNGEIKLKGVLGYEFYSDDTVYRQFDTVYRERQKIDNKRYTLFQTNAVFLETELTLHKLFNPLVGVRADMYTGDYRNKMWFNSITTYPEVHETITPKDYSHVSPKVGFYSILVDDVLRFRTNVSNGYVLPPDNTLFDTYQHLNPSQIWQYEAGLTATYEKYIWFDIAGYMIDVNNEVNEQPVGSNIYVNSGTTRRWGIETALKVNPIKYIELGGTFTWMDSKVRRIPYYGINPTTGYLNVGNTLTKNSALPNIPEFQAEAELDWNSPIGLGGGFAWTYVGPQFTDIYGTASWSRALLLAALNNTYSLGLSETDTKYKGYNLFDICLTYTIMLNNIPMVFRIDAKNILDQRWAGYAGNYTIWSVGMPRSFSGSVSMKF